MSVMNLTSTIIIIIKHAVSKRLTKLNENRDCVIKIKNKI